MSEPTPSLETDQFLNCSPEVWKYDKRRTAKGLGGGQQLKYICDRDRLVMMLAAKGLTNKAIQAHLAARGTDVSTQWISRIRNSELGKARINELMSKAEGEMIEEAASIGEMASEAVQLLHSAVATGLVPRPRLGEDGKPDLASPPEFDVVSARERLSAAKELANRSPDTAPVQRTQRLGVGRLTKEEAKEHLEHALEVQRELGALREVKAQVVSDPEGDEEKETDDAISE